ncbi:MAG: glycosyltransferase family 9 protein [Sulfuricellaceae bacterium]|jgi:heptosyltransferase-3
MEDRAPKFLVIRRDNIGDLVCTTPLFSALRTHFPNAEICALVNSYNIAVLENNSDIDAVYAYTKAKHRPAGKSVAGIYWDRLTLFLELRRKHFDYAVLAATAPTSVPRALKLARFIRPKHIIGYSESAIPQRGGIDFPVPYSHRTDTHEVEEVLKLLSPLGIDGTPPLVKVCPNSAVTEHARETIVRPAGKRLIGVHISARKPSQRWPTERFVELIRELARSESMAFALFWSPGDEDNPLHPGDDRKAHEILSALSGLPIVAYPTHRLQELVAGLSLCDALICSDGGAMHLAAGLGKPILCFFGKSSSVRWRPWGVSHVLIQPPSQEVTDISIEEALTGFNELLKKVNNLTPRNNG